MVLYKVADVIEKLGVGRSLVYDLIARKELPSIRIGRCIRVSSSALEQWVQDKQQKEQSGCSSLQERY
jgi:prophage regulatory protein